MGNLSTKSKEPNESTIDLKEREERTIDIVLPSHTIISSRIRSTTWTCAHEIVHYETTTTRTKDVTFKYTYKGKLPMWVKLFFNPGNPSDAHLFEITSEEKSLYWSVTIGSVLILTVISTLTK